MDGMESTSVSRVRWVVLTSAIIGICCCLVATVVSFWAAIGATPVALYGSTSRLATLLRVADIPIEFIGLAWFTAVGLIYAFAPPRETSSAYMWVFLTAVPIAGAGMWIARENLRCWPFIVATGASVLVLLAAGSERTPPMPTWPTLLKSDAMRTARSPLAVAVALGFLWMTTMAAQFVSLKTASVSATEVSDQGFKRWFLSHSRVQAANFIAAKGIRVVAFTDYQCPACASTLPLDEAAIETFRNTYQEPIEVVYKDFPLESECNATLKVELHPMACEAAAALRLVRARLGESAAQEFGHALYRNRSRFASGYIEAQLNERHLGPEYKQQYAALLKDVAADVALGQQLGVHSTPTLFVNGTKLPGASVKNFQLALQFEAERLGGVAVGTPGGSGVRVQ